MLFVGLIVVTLTAAHADTALEASCKPYLQRDWTAQELQLARTKRSVPGKCIDYLCARDVLKQKEALGKALDADASRRCEGAAAPRPALDVSSPGDAPVAVPILDAKALDRSADACQDFYKFACGNWIKTFHPPPDKPSYNREMTSMTEQNDVLFNGILKTLASGPSSSLPYAQKLSDLYQTCMHREDNAPASKAALNSMFDAVDAIQTPADLARELATLHLSGVDALFSFSSAQDNEDSTRVIGFAGPGGMALPAREYYLNTDKKSLETVRRYKAHLAAVLISLGHDAKAARREAERIFGFEKQLAAGAIPLEDKEDSAKQNHPVTLEQLKALTPEIDWSAYFDAIGVKDVARMNVTWPDFFKGLSGFLKKNSMADIKAYLKWEIANDNVATLGGRYEKESFDFWQKYLHGQKEMAPRWKTCVGAVEGGLRDALGAVFVDRLPAQEIKDRTKGIVDRIKKAFDENLDTLTWLDGPTREKARSKLGKVTEKIGYPEPWRNYTALEIGSDSYLLNSARATRFENRRELDKIGRPVDRSDWDMGAWEANAYYDPSLNQIVLPIGELVPPVFDLKASDGANYGSLAGGTIGHELTHGFDINGSNFDEDGNLKNWWSASVKADFEKRNACLVDQANRYEVLAGLHVNGKATLTENLADQGGVKLGLVALQKAAADPSRPPVPKFEEFNELQQYFLGYAQSWCTKTTDAALRYQVMNDPHPPAEFRVNGVVMNRPEFAAAFGCKAGARLAPVNRCAVW